MTVRKPPSTRLAVEHWLKAGHTLLAEQGSRALKVERLRQQAGVTRGSVYWHFADIDSYRTALVERETPPWKRTGGPWPGSASSHRKSRCPP